MNDVAIANQALVFLGADRIMSFTEDNANARKVNDIYAQTRDEVLRGHPWNFAITRVALAQLATVPLYDYAIEYQLPATCLRVLGTNIPDLEYKIEGRKLLCDSTGVQIKYIKQVTDPTQFDANFIEALAAKLAAKLAYTITESKTLFDAATKWYAEILADARSADSQEGTPEAIIDGDWVNARAE